MTALDMTVGDFFKAIEKWEEQPANSLAPFMLSAIAFKRDGEEILASTDDLAGGAISINGFGGVGLEKC